MKLNIKNYQDSRRKEFLDLLSHGLHSCKPCSGVLMSKRLRFKLYETKEDKIITDLMPGNIIVDCNNELNEYHTTTTNIDLLHSLADFLVIVYNEKEDNYKKKIENAFYVPFARTIRKFEELTFRNPKFSNNPLIACESTLSLAKFIIPTKYKDIDEILWRSHSTDKYNSFLMI